MCCTQQYLSTLTYIYKRNSECTYTKSIQQKQDILLSLIQISLASAAICDNVSFCISQICSSIYNDQVQHFYYSLLNRADSIVIQASTYQMERSEGHLQQNCGKRGYYDMKLMGVSRRNLSTKAGQIKHTRNGQFNLA